MSISTNDRTSALQTPDSPGADPTIPQHDGRARETGRHTLASLRRLYPYARPAVPSLVGSTLTAICATLAGLAFPLVIQAIIDGPIAHRNLAGLWGPGAVLVVLGVVEAALFCVRRILSTRPTMRVEARMRSDLYAHLQRLPVAFHDRFPAGQLLSRAVSDLSAIRRFLAFGVVFLIVNACTMLAGLVVLSTIDWGLGLVVAVMAIPLIGVCFVFERKYQVLARRAQDQVGDLATQVEESVLGIRIVKAFGRGAHLRRSFLRQARALQDTELSKGSMVSALWAGIIAIPEIALAVCLFLGIERLADGGLTTGGLVAFFGIALALRWPIESIGWLLAMANETAAASDRYFEVMDEPVTITTPVDPIRSDRGRGRLEFRDVSFRFPDAPQTGRRAELLRGVDLELLPGESVAVVGATGSGKTTLTALVNRLYDVSGGAVLLDGVDVRKLDLPDLRARVAVAFEDPTLFSASVRENVLLGKPDGTDDDVWTALALAQADFVKELPWGLDTRIGEQGLSLSGGQRQRLALARAVVGKPEVIVLDDPLSALDIHTEAQVERALKNVLAGTTALIVAHRASTVLLADRVALLRNGRIEAVGRHGDLMAREPEYRALLASAGDLAAAGHLPARPDEPAREVTS